MAPEQRPCRSCGAPVVFAKHERTGKAGPLVRDPHGTFRVWPDDGGYLYGKASDADPEGARYSSHFADCPAAQRWRERIARGGGTKA